MTSVTPVRCSTDWAMKPRRKQVSPSSISTRCMKICNCLSHFTTAKISAFTSRLEHVISRQMHTLILTYKLVRLTMRLDWWSSCNSLLRQEHEQLTFLVAPARWISLEKANVIQPVQNIRRSREDLSSILSATRTSRVLHIHGYLSFFSLRIFGGT